MFSEVLKGIVEESGGGIGAVLMGLDGIAIDQFFRPCEGVDLQLVAVEYANVLKEIRKAADILGTGDLEEVAIKTGRFHVLIRSLTEDYFVFLVLERGGNFGKGRYLLLRESVRLVEALK